MKKHKALKIILIIIGVLVVLGVIGSLGGTKNDESTVAPSSQESIVDESDSIDDESQSVTTEKQENQEVQADPQASWSMEQKNAYNAAKKYLAFKGFSKKGLIDQLSSEYGENYPVDVATFAVEQLETNGEVDWYEQAEKCAQEYLEYSEFSKQGLIDQLTSEYGEGFTYEEASAAVEKVYN